MKNKILKKVIILGVSLLFGVLSFSADYEVIVEKKVSMTESEKKKNNEEIEKRIRAINGELKYMIPLIIAEEIQKEMEKLNMMHVEEEILTSFINDLINEMEFKINKIVYITNKKAKVEIEMITPDIEKINENTLNKNLSEKLKKEFGYSLEEIEKLVEKGENEISLENINKIFILAKNSFIEEMKKLPLTSEILSAEMKKNGDEWDFYIEEKLYD